MSYAVKEIYYTIQGEGAQTGRPAVFSGVGMAWEDLVVATALYGRYLSTVPHEIG